MGAAIFLDVNDRGPEMTLHSTSSIEHSRHIQTLPLAGKIALVTGGGTGIGRAAALAFARKGASVALASRRRAELESVAADIAGEGGQAVVIPTDVTDERAIAGLVAGAVERFGRLDIAFNNAGMQSYSPIEQLGLDEFDRVMATNVRGVWLLLKHEIAAMRAAGDGGAIVNTSSIAATGATAGLSAYAPSKAALDAMTRVLALEIGADGIRVNNVSPGLTRTPMNEGLPDSLLSAVAAHAALKRLGEPEDIADVAVWLCTDEARFVTGQSILVDGGFNLAGVR
jgi:NAD(P)-dependent dehydrogenase (short-subunit alcohol dehydrogenase family)